MPVSMEVMFYLTLGHTIPMPRVAVCMGAYNGSGYLRDLLWSLCEQTFKDFAVYIFNDGSEDDTLEVIDSFRDRLDIKVKNSKGIHNIGTVKSKVVRFALKDKPDFIQMVDSDDVLEPTFLEAMLREIEEGFDFVVCDGVTFGDQSFPIHNEYSDKKRIIHTNPFLSWIMLRAEVAKDINYRVGMGHYEDWDLHLRLLMADKTYGIVQEPLYNYRIHPGQFHRVTEQDEFRHRVNLWEVNNINPEAPC